MTKLNQNGAISGLVISFVLTVLLLIAAVAFGGWAYSSRQDFKENTDQKVSLAVDKAVQQESIVKDKQFSEDSKKPLKTYNGPDAYGSARILFPKTWSGYVDASGSGDALVSGYFAPGVVPSITDQKSIFALRVQVVSQKYADVLETFAGQQQAGKLKVSAYALPKVPKVVGVKVSGQLADQKNVTMVVLPLRSQTLQIWTEGSQYLGDFNKNILPYFTFSP